MINTRMKLLRTTVFSAGLLGMLLRALLYATAIDQKGLLAAGHWATWLILILTGLMLALLPVATWKAQGPKTYEDCFPGSALQGITSLMVAVAVTLRAIPDFSNAADSLELVASISGIVAGVAMAIVAICRFTGKQPNFLCHSALCLFFALQMVSQYRHWSADPQLMDYGFYLAAFICLMLTSYFLAGFEADMGSHRGIWLCSMAAPYFCLLALPESGDGALLIACALWALFCAPQSQAKVRRQRPAMMMDEESEDENP